LGTSNGSKPAQAPTDVTIRYLQAVCYHDAEKTERNSSMCTGDANTQAAGVAVYRIGCFFEAIQRRWRFPIAGGRSLAAFMAVERALVGVVCKVPNFSSSLVVVWMLFCLPESPRWLVGRAWEDG